MVIINWFRSLLNRNNNRKVGTLTHVKEVYHG